TGPAGAPAGDRGPVRPAGCAVAVRGRPDVPAAGERPGVPAPTPLTDAVIRVGFDLDMTLVDSRPGIAATYRELSARTGVYVDADVVVSRLGPPLAHEMAHWFPPERVGEAVAGYRALYPEYALAPSRPLPGAGESLGSVQACGGVTPAVTAKVAALAPLHLGH